MASSGASSRRNCSYAPRRQPVSSSSSTVRTITRALPALGSRAAASAGTVKALDPFKSVVNSTAFIFERYRSIPPGSKRSCGRSPAGVHLAPHAALQAARATRLRLGTKMSSRDCLHALVRLGGDFPAKVEAANPSRSRETAQFNGLVQIGHRFCVLISKRYKNCLRYSAIPI